jgi:bifunctional UDP-N-acetylglucosamine pyrophosphorylase/glucosamine-1-phosphate N-acetyltransferase
MRSALPKPLHTLAGRAMIDFVIDAADIPGVAQVVVVLSPDLSANDDLLGHLQQRLGDRLGIAIQDQQRGTGDALRRALPLIHDTGSVIVLFADHPLLTPGRMMALSDSLKDGQSALSILTCEVDAAAGYGRVVRSPGGAIERIAERKDDEPDSRVGRTEINSGMMAVRLKWLETAISRLTPSPTTGELYLTQLVELAAGDGVAIGSVPGEAAELIGINDRNDLALAEGLLQTRIRSALGASGVRFVAPDSSIVDFDVEIGSDTVILPGCLIKFGTVIGRGCEIGPHSVLTAATIGDGCAVRSSYVSHSEVQAGSDVGPFSHVRDGAFVGSDVHVGNFAEIKNSRLDEGVRMGHFSYVGDASVGRRTNIGAGVVTCNFDGKDKHHSEIGEDAFIGSDTMLVAPITVGDGAVTGAGSVVTRNVPSGGRVAGVPARQSPGTVRKGRGTS